MVAVSACLLGLNCRYDGGHKRNQELLKELKCFEIAPFCPEVNILGSPREAIDLFLIDEKIKAISKESKKDFTNEIKNEAKRFFTQFPDIKRFYFKSKSPSCALCSAKVYDKDYNLLYSNGLGIFAKEIKTLYNNAKFIEID